MPNSPGFPAGLKYLNRYYNNDLYHHDITFMRQQRLGGWRKDRAAKKMWKALSLLTTCTPRLMDAILNDRGEISMEDRLAMPCCHWQEELAPAGCCRHKTGAGLTNYLNVIIGKKYGKAILEKAHRLMCYAMHGPPPSGHEARHICMKTSCINQYHVEWSTTHENNLDVHKLSKARRHASKGVKAT